MSILEKTFGTLSTGEEVKMYRLLNESGAYADVIDYGCCIVKIVVPDKYNNMVDVVLGYDNVKQYTVNKCFFGAIIGRNGNRIADAKFKIGTREFKLEENEFENSLHSGPNGYEKQIWNVTAKDDAKNSITFSRLSPDGENGFPGNFNVSVTYEFTEENELKIIYDGVSDQATVANMTNHSYFNLNGEGNGSVLGQYLQMNCSQYTPVVDEKAIPTGDYAPVAGTVMDFTTGKKIGRDISADFQQLKYVGGYDHNYVADNYEKGKQRTIATAYSDLTGIAMDVNSDLPCVQLYAGNFIDDQWGKNGNVYNQRDGFCLETQSEPNACNQEGFHSTIIEAGEKYHTQTSYKFYVKK